MSKYRFTSDDEQLPARSFKKFLNESNRHRPFDDEVRKERKDTRKKNKPVRGDRGQW